AASSRPLDEIAGFAELRRLGAGVDHLAIHAPAEQRVETRYGIRDMVVSRLGSDYLDWRRAVVRLKEKGGLYAVDERGVRFVDKGLFGAERGLYLWAHHRPWSYGLAAMAFALAAGWAASRVFRRD